MVQLASDVHDLAMKVQQAATFASYIERVMAEPSEFVENLMEQNIYVLLNIKSDVWDLTINNIDSQASAPQKE